MCKRKWGVWIILALVIVIILACDCQSEAVSTIEVKALEVLRAPAGGNWTSIAAAAPQRLSNGDRVSTSPEGEGLLKFPCAWLRLYRDSELQLREVSVDGANLAAATGEGLVDTSCVRLNVDAGVSPPEARIETHATKFFFAFRSDRHITLLWVGAGKASLTNLRRDGVLDTTVVVPEGWWSVARQGGVPEAPRPASQIGLIIDEMNLRDVYEKALREWGVQAPATATPTATRVTPTPTRTFTPTPTHTRTMTPLPAGMVSGRVLAGAKGIADAKVTLTSSGTYLALIGRGVSTNSNGYYSFNNVYAGKYEVRVDATGYKTDAQTISVATGQSVTLDFHLTRAPAASGTNLTMKLLGCFNFDQGVYFQGDPDTSCPSSADVEWTGSTLLPINGASIGMPSSQSSSYEGCANANFMVGGVSNPLPGKYYCVSTQQDQVAVIRIGSVRPSPYYDLTMDWWRY